MLRVLLRVEGVNLRVKEAVLLQIVIRKGTEAINYCQNQPLINGQVQLDRNEELFIDSCSPSLQLELYLVIGAVRRLGGVAVLDLAQLEIDVPHSITVPLQKSPLLHSTLQLNLAYM